MKTDAELVPDTIEIKADEESVVELSVGELDLVSGGQWLALFV